MLGLRVRGRGGWDRTAPRGGTQKRVSLGLHPVSLRKSKEMGWNGQQGEETSTQGNGAHVQGANKVPPFLWVCACAPLRWVVVVAPCCHSTPFLWCLPKETVSSRQRKALFYCGGSTIRVSAAASVDYTFLARLGEGVARVVVKRPRRRSAGGVLFTLCVCRASGCRSACSGRA